jgi:uncharacterized protein YjbI with pentapeptide repeats
MFGATLTGANLTSVDLTNAHLRDANLTGVVLSQADGLNSVGAKLYYFLAHTAKRSLQLWRQSLEHIISVCGTRIASYQF